MKIVQNCVEAKVITRPLELPSGTVFKLKGYTQVYLKLSSGFVNLTDNRFSEPNELGINSVDLLYPNAKVVLE